MSIIARLFRFGAVGVAVLGLVASGNPLSAQTAPNAASEELNQAELLKAYRQMHEQLQAIATNRIETETAAFAQTAALAGKLDAIKSAIEAERERRQIEMAHSNPALPWIAVSFGGVGLLLMLGALLFQWRAIDRIATSTASLRSRLVEPDRPRPWDDGLNVLSDPALSLSHQRLKSALAQMEQRLFLLESTSGQRSSITVASHLGSTRSPRKASDDDDKPEWIAVLLNKAQIFLNADRASEALACYDEILKLDPSHFEAWGKRSAVMEQLQQEALSYPASE